MRKSLKVKGIVDSWRNRWNACGCGSPSVGEANATPGGDVGCVANTGLRKVGFRICGNGWTYRRIFGCVANTGVRGEGVGNS